MKLAKHYAVGFAIYRRYPEGIPLLLFFVLFYPFVGASCVEFYRYITVISEHLGYLAEILEQYQLVRARSPMTQFRPLSLP